MNIQIRWFPKFLLSIFFLYSISATADDVAVGPKLEDFANPPAFIRTTISPLGDYIATLMYSDETAGNALVILRTADLKATAKVNLQDSEEVGRFWWVNPTQVVLEPALKIDSEESFYSGELISINANNGSPNYLFGFRADANSIGTHIQHGSSENATAEIIKRIVSDPQHAVIKISEFDDSKNNNISYAAKLNLDSGVISDRLAAPIPGYTRFIADDKGVVRYAIIDKNDKESQIYTRDPEHASSEWKLLSKAEGFTQASPLGFSADEKEVYLLSAEATGNICLNKQSTISGETKQLSCDEVADIDNVIYSFDGKTPIAVTYENGKTRTVILDPEHPDAKTLERLFASFPGRALDHFSHTDDGSKLIFRAYSDRDPGEYFLFDTHTLKARSLAIAMENIVPEEMGTRQPITYKSRDGLDIHGFLTIPPKADPKNLPMVVLPHGGPYYTQDKWGWNADAQLLATHGYAVLQINFRGSNGYGVRFKSAGILAWDTGMINDIIDGTKWAIQQGYANPNRLCIYGASYGGYAAVMSAVKEPDLYHCVISESGVYDLNLWAKDADFSQSTDGKNYVADFVGNSPERLKQASPLTYIGQLKSAIMIVHGKQDKRTPFTQATALRSALDKRDYPYVWLVHSREGHGFRAPENQLDLYEKMLAFLDKNIGPQSISTGKHPDSQAK